MLSIVDVGPNALKSIQSLAASCSSELAKHLHNDHRMEWSKQLRLDPNEWLANRDRCLYASLSSNIWITKTEPQNTTNAHIYVKEVLLRVGNFRGKKKGMIGKVVEKCDSITKSHMFIAILCSNGRFKFLVIAPHNVKFVTQILGVVLTLARRQNGCLVEVYVAPSSAMTDKIPDG